MREISLENIEKLSRKELKAAIVNCFQYAPDASPVDRLAVLQEAQFYTRELERRSDSFTSRRDLFLELIVIGLIAWEIFLGYREMRIQGIEFGQETQIMSDLEKTSAATSQNLVNAASILKTMNDNLQHQLDFYYEPSIVFTYRGQGHFPDFDVHNYGRSVITIFGVKSNGRACSLPSPQKVSSGIASPLEASALVSRLVQRVESSDANTELAIYFRAEDGKEFQHRAVMIRGSVAEGATFSIEQQKTEPLTWNSELASAEKCSK